MRTLVILIVLFIPASLFAQQGIVWGNEITVADGAVYGNIRPRLSLDADGDPIVLFGKGGAGELFVSKLTGGTFATPVQVSPAGLDTYLANWTGPDIAASGDTVIVVFKAQPVGSGNIYSVRSTDGGATFSDTIRVDDYDAGQTWMPALDIDENGNPHVTYMTFAPTGGDERIAVCHSTDAGMSYAPQQTITTTVPGIACDCCPPEYVVKGNYQLALFRNNETNIRDVWGTLSDDNGATFPSSANLDELAWNISSCPSTGPHGVIINDSVYVVSASRATGDYRVYVSAAGLSGGLSLNSVTMMTPPTSLSSDMQNFPRVSGENDTIVMIWEERELANTDIMAAVTTTANVGALTSFKARVNIDQDGFQGKPDVMYKSGVVHAVFQDLESGNVIYRSGTVGDVTGTEELWNNQVSFFPNPSENEVYISGIDGSDPKKVTVLNSLGQTIPFTLEANTLKLEKSVAGVYSIVFELNDGQIFQKRLIIK